MNSRSRFVIVLFMFALLISGDAVGGSSKLDAESLAGIEGVGVLVEGLDNEVEAAGLSVADLQTRIELRLRVAGVRVLTKGTFPRYPTVYANINALAPANSPVVFYSYHLSFGQAVYTNTEPQQIIFGATTWEKGGIARVPRASFRDDVLGDVALLVDAFANAFLSVNPPAPKGD